MPAFRQLWLNNAIYMVVVNAQRFTFGWLVGEIIQRVTGRPFSEVLEAEIAKPLELDGLYVGVPEDQMHRRAQLI